MTPRISVPLVLKSEILKRDNHSCQKCGFQDSEGDDLEIHHISLGVDGVDNDLSNLITLCSICHHFAPDNPSDFPAYLGEKVDWKVLETFRKSGRSISKSTKKGMLKKFRDGNLTTRAPLGYKIINKEILPADNSFIIQEIYQAFLNTNTSLTQLAKKYNLSVNGLKKVLTNETYLGKLKFSGQTSQGKHAHLISQELFDNVQKKLKNI